MNEDGGSCVVPTEWKVAAGTMSIYCSVSRNCYLLPLSSARAGAEQVLCCAHPHREGLTARQDVPRKLWMRIADVSILYS